MAASDLAVGKHDRPEDHEMPRYEVVTHIAVELDGAMPEEAAAVYRRALLAVDGLALRGLAVWPSTRDSTPTPLPPPLQQQLIEFFAAVARHAAAEEAVFRARVEDIFAGASAGPEGNAASHPEEWSGGTGNAR
jgi:hypothetical protein